MNFIEFASHFRAESHIHNFMFVVRHFLLQKFSMNFNPLFHHFRAPKSKRHRQYWRKYASFHRFPFVLVIIFFRHIWWTHFTHSFFIASKILFVWATERLVSYTINKISKFKYAFSFMQTAYWLKLFMKLILHTPQTHSKKNKWIIEVVQMAYANDAVEN